MCEDMGMTRCTVSKPFTITRRDASGVPQTIKRFAVIALRENPSETYYAFVNEPPVQRAGIEERRCERAREVNNSVCIRVPRESGDIAEVQLMRVNPENIAHCKIIVGVLRAYLTTTPGIRPEVASIVAGTIEYLQTPHA